MQPQAQNIKIDMHDADITDTLHDRVMACRQHIEPPVHAVTMQSESTMIGITFLICDARGSAAAMPALPSNCIARIVVAVVVIKNQTFVSCHLQVGTSLSIVVIVVVVPSCMVRGPRYRVVRPGVCNDRFVRLSLARVVDISYAPREKEG